MIDESLSLGHCLNSGVKVGAKNNSEFFAKIDADDGMEVLYK